MNGMDPEPDEEVTALVGDLVQGVCSSSKFIPYSERLHAQDFNVEKIIATDLFYQRPASLQSVGSLLSSQRLNA